MKKNLLLFIGLLFSNILFAQQSLIKQLNSEIENEKNLGKKAVLMSILAETSRFVDVKQSLNLSKKAIALSKKEGTEEDQTNAYIHSIKVFKKADSIQQMVIAVDSAVYLAEKLNKPILKGTAYFHKGSVEMQLNEYQKGMMYYFRALGNLEKTKEYITLANTYYFISAAYSENGDIENEKKYAKLCLETALKSSNPEMLGFAYQAMSSFYTDQFDNEKQAADFDLAISYNEKALEIFKQHSDEIITQSSYGVIALNIADLYYQNYKPDYKEKIIYYIDLALPNAIKYNYLPVASNCYFIKSELAKKEGNFEEAEKLLLQAKDVAEKSAYKDEYVLTMIYDALSKFYDERHLPNEALLYSKKYLESYKKLNDTKKKSDIRLLEAKFQTQKKEEQLQLLTQKNKLQKSLNYLYLALAFFAILGLLFFYRSSRFKLQFEKQKSIVLENQKEEAELLAKLKDEEAARIEAERKLVESQKEQMQKELLAKALQVEHKNDLLLNLTEKIGKEKFDSKALQKLNSILREELMIDNDFDKIKSELQSVHPDFFKKLQEKSPQKLTSLDLKYCAAIHVKLSTKQMALLFNVEPESIRMSKYRLKQKLNIPKEINIDDWISYF